MLKIKFRQIQTPKMANYHQFTKGKGCVLSVDHKPANNNPFNGPLSTMTRVSFVFMKIVHFYSKFHVLLATLLT